MAKEALNANSFTKEARPTTGTLINAEGFGLGRFGSARFGGGNILGYQQTKEVLATNSFTKGALESNSLSKVALEANSFSKEALASVIS